MLIICPKLSYLALPRILLLARNPRLHLPPIPTGRSGRTRRFDLPSASASKLDLPEGWTFCIYCAPTPTGTGRSLVSSPLTTPSATPPPAILQYTLCRTIASWTPETLATGTPHIHHSPLTIVAESTRIHIRTHSTTRALGHVLSTRLITLARTHRVDIAYLRLSLPTPTPTAGRAHTLIRRSTKRTRRPHYLLITVIHERRQAKSTASQVPVPVPVPSRIPTLP